MPEDLKKAAQQEVHEFGLMSQALERFTTAKQALKTQISRDPIDPVDELVSAIGTLNRRHQLLVERREFIFRPHALATNDGGCTCAGQ